MSDHDLLIAMDTKLDRLIADSADQESRIRSIEGKIYIWSGAASVVGAILGIVGNRLV